MDETSMEQSIANYKQQISQIDSLLLCCDEENKDELNQLKEDITKLIKVTEESLLSFKKSRLLQDLAESTSSLSGEKEGTFSTTTSAPLNPIEDVEEEADGQDFMGIKCRVLHTHEWGQSGFQNAMVFDTEETDTGEQKVRVLFLNPTHMSMVPCRFFMNGECKFDEDKCRFSHGYLADVSELEEYIEPDFRELAEGEQCLARYEDGIWYKATIRKIYDETIDIHYDTYNSDATVDIHEVLPINSKAHNYDSSSESDVDDESSRDVHEDSYVAYVSATPLSSTGALGEWESHTKGIGSKLMAKMGYEFGKGLGKEGDGRVNPIEIIVLPAGKSLDKVAELREKGKLYKPLKKRRSKSKLASLDGNSSNRGTSTNSNQGADVFEFINSKLTHYHGDDAEKNFTHKEKVKHNIEESYQHLKKIRKCKRKGQSSSKRVHTGPNWNLQLFKNNEKAMVLKRQLAKQKESLRRNIGRDQGMVERLKSSINSLESELGHLENSSKVIENKLHSKAEHKKLTVF